MSILDIKIADIDEFIRELTRLKLSARTIRTYLAPLNLAFSEAMRLDIIQKNPVSQAKLPKDKKEEKEIFTKEEMCSILESAAGALKIATMIGFFVGARIGEILALKWSDIENGKMTISRTRNVLGTLNAPKSGKKRVFKMPQQLTDFLNSLERTSDWVLGEEFCYQGKISREFKHLQEKLEIEPKTTHTMRHTCISLLLSAGENPMLIRPLLKPI